jgi:hypothetical protein
MCHEDLLTKKLAKKFVLIAQGSLKHHEVCLQSPRLLSGVVVCFILVRISERLPTWTTRDLLSGTIRESSVLIEFSPVGCTSIRITVTLGYEYRLFVAVIM